MRSIKSFAKRLFILPYLLTCALASIHIVYALLTAEAFSPSWLGALLAVTPLVLMAIITFSFPYAPGYRFMGVPVIAAMVGAGLAVIEMRPLPTFYALVLGLGGVMVYVFWYSYLDRDENRELKVGAHLPELVFEDLEGRTHSSREFLGQRALYVFFRGDWCPLCRSQLRELGDYCDSFLQRGVQPVLISPQPLDRMQGVAMNIDPRMKLFRDIDNRAAKTLGIVHRDGVPFGLRRYGRDTVLPTALLVDAAGVLQMVDLPVNFRFRARPAQFFDAIDRIWG